MERKSRQGPTGELGPHMGQWEPLFPSVNHVDPSSSEAEKSGTWREPGRLLNDGPSLCSLSLGLRAEMAEHPSGSWWPFLLWDINKVLH